MRRLKLNTTIIITSILASFIILGIANVEARTTQITNREFKSNLLDVGTSGKDFTLKDVLTGQMVSFSSLQGRAVVLDFFATWCVPCQDSMADLATVESKFSDSELIIISINTDVEPDATLRTFASTYNMDWYIVKDTEGLSLHYQVSSIPTVYVFDKNLNVHYRGAGGVTASFLENIVNQILGIENSSPAPTSNPNPGSQDGFWFNNWYWIIIILVFGLVAAGVFIQRRRVIMENKRIREQKLKEKRRKQLKRRR